jgi:DNA-binding PadR family transcriptional regulator
MATRRTASTRYAILGLLSLEPMSGYDIRRASIDTLRHFWHESYGQIYPTLATLERERLIRPVSAAEAARSGAREGTRATRKVYTLTPAGKRALAVWRKRPAASRPFRNVTLLQMFFGDAGSAKDLLAHVDRMRAEESAHLASYAVLERKLAREAATHPSLPYWRATLRYGHHRSSAIVRWCDETARALRQSASHGKRKRP